MGAGIAYQYKWWVLVDEDALWSPDDLEDEDKALYAEHPEAFYDNRRDAWEDFKDHAAYCFGATRIKDNWQVCSDRDAWAFAETDRLYLCINNGGGAPCLFLQPKTWQQWRVDPYYSEGSWEDVAYNLNADAKRGFNKLIKSYRGCNPIRMATSAWTSFPYGQVKGFNKWVLYK